MCTLNQWTTYVSRFPVDDGTFSPPAVIVGSAREPIDGALSPDPNGTLHLVEAYRHVLYRSSTHGGMTWSHGVQLAASETHVSEPAIAIDTHGHVHAARRTWGRNPQTRQATAEVYFTRSLDAGANFSPAVRLQPIFLPAAATATGPDNTRY